MSTLSAYVAFNKGIGGQTDIILSKCSILSKLETTTTTSTTTTTKTTTTTTTTINQKGEPFNNFQS